MAGILAQTFVLLFSAVCAVVGLALLFVIVYIWRKSRQYDHLPGPKPSSFILGNIPDLKRNYEKGVPFTETVYQWCLQYGDLFTYRLLHINVIVAVRPEAIKSVLVTEGFPKHEYFYRNVKWLCGARFLGDGLVSDVNHDTWTHQRAAMNPAFIRGSLKSLMGSFNTVGESFCDRLANLADGKTMLTMLHELNRATLDAIGKVAYAVDIDSLHNDVNPYSSSIHKAFEGMRETFTNPLAMMNPFALWSLKRDVRSSCESLRNLAREVINKRKKAMKNDDYIPDDILTNIIKFEESQTDDADAMEVAIDNFVTFFVAGQETTANMLSFALLELGRKPDVLARLREEVEEVLGARRDVDYEDLSSLNYCDNVIKETLRMYPPAAVTFREVNRDGFTLEGYPIPKGSNLMASTYVCSRHPDLHPDPLEFRPERFDDEKTRPTPYTSFPFILGPRNCIGQNFARMESKVLLSKFVQRFDIHLDPTQNFGIEETTTMRPKDGTRATLTLREQTA